jgi:hypothetical protein
MITDIYTTLSDWYASCLDIKYSKNSKEDVK